MNLNNLLSLRTKTMHASRDNKPARMQHAALTLATLALLGACSLAPDYQAPRADMSKCCG